MRFVFPAEQLIPFKNEFLGFKFTTTLFSVVARYILGIGAYYSNNIEAALIMHKSILLESIQLAKNNNDFPIYRKIRDTTKDLVVDESGRIAMDSYHKNRDYKKMGTHIEYLKSIEPNDYRGQLLSAIYLFRTQRKIDCALDEIAAASKNKRDYTWAYSKAFLMAYQGDLQAAYSAYQTAFYHPTDPSAHLQSEEFMREILHEEPDKFQLYYCIGLINLKKKEDIGVAVIAFNNFIDFAKDKDMFLPYVDFARIYVSRCK